MARSRLIIEPTFLSPAGTQKTPRQHDAQFIIKKAVAIRKSGSQVRQVRSRKVFHRHFVIFRFPQRFVRRFLYDTAPVERLEVTTEIHRVITGRQVGRKLAFGRSIFHDQIDSATNAVSLHIRRQGFGHLQTVQHLGGEDIKRHKAVLIIGTRNLHSVHQRIVIPFVHTP